MVELTAAVVCFIVLNDPGTGPTALNVAAITSLNTEANLPGIKPRGKVGATIVNFTDGRIVYVIETVEEVVAAIDKKCRRV